jgi:hypothetical protein
VTVGLVGSGLIAVVAAEFGLYSIAVVALIFGLLNPIPYRQLRAELWPPKAADASVDQVDPG